MKKSAELSNNQRLVMAVLEREPNPMSAYMILDEPWVRLSRAVAGVSCAGKADWHGQGSPAGKSERLHRLQSHVLKRLADGVCDLQQM